MATYTLISSNVLSSSAASVTFSSIPATYTDLVLRWSARQDFNSASTRNGGTMTFNNNTSSVYSETNINGDGSTVTSGRNSNNIEVSTFTPGASPGATANTFGSCELYIPNYISSANKPISHFIVSESNTATGPSIKTFAILFRSSSAVSSIELNAGFNYVSGSSFYLYGISNA